MKMHIWYITVVLIFSGCKKEDEVLHIPNELEGVYLAYWTSYSYEFNDTIYTVNDTKSNNSFGMRNWIIESIGNNYRSFPIDGKNSPSSGEKEVVPKEVVRYFVFGKPIHNRIFFENYFSHIYNDQKTSSIIMIVSLWLLIAVILQSIPIQILL